MDTINKFIKEINSIKGSEYIFGNPITSGSIFILFNLNKILAVPNKKFILPIKIEKSNNKNNLFVKYYKKDIDDKKLLLIENLPNIKINSISDKIIELNIINNNSIK